MSDVAKDFITFARELASTKNFITALDMYLCAFANKPRCKKRLRNEFIAVLSKMNEELAAIDNKAAIFTNLERAIELFPDDVELLNETGSYLYKYGYMFEAMHYFENALYIDIKYVSAEKNLNTTKTRLFPRNQYRILNDRKRNIAYRAAVRSCVTAADNVININAGTGLSALYASECTSERVYACETSKAMAQLAERVQCENRLNNVVVDSTVAMALTYKHWYNGCTKRSVLLTDLIDSGLFGENFLQALFQAWANLHHSSSTVIPGKAEYFIAGIKCNELYYKYNLGRKVKNILKVTRMNVHPSILCRETYCSEDVNLYKNIKYMSEPKSLFTIDFNSFKDVHDKLYRQEPYIAELVATENGEINMVIGWFNLYLTDDIMLTSDPRSSDRATAYQQAVFFDFLSKKVRRNESINVPFQTYGGRLTTIQDMNTAITRISLETIAYLNDTEFTSMVMKSIGAVSVHLVQTVAMEHVDILDLSPFPLFGVLMMKRGANSLICLAKTLDDEVFLQTVLVANGIPKSKVTILVTEYWPIDVFKNKKFHVIFSQVLDLNGDINVRRHWIVEHLKESHLIPGGICLPSSVTMMGQLVYSDYLEMNNRLSDKNVDFCMAKHVNRYQVSQMLHLDIARLKYEALSDALEIASCEELKTNVVKVPILKDGECNAILCWYKVQMMVNWKEMYTDRSNSFVHAMAYMIGPCSLKVFRGGETNVVRYVDPADRSYKLLLDIVPH